ncbi:ribosomal protein S18-alanine N-acetyltransferase [Herbaspirillum rhizosphaerae]|uniref:[Ribosomal protein bS18]-alanine N-acetyltransferase n=2 Tax=Herbaspirillum rhizosphaerae TaxID=346179 RepID=A0ABW8ZBV8_9BURK
MQVVDMDEVVQIEEKIYGHPWTRGNFLDSLFSGYQTLTMRDPTGRLLGYFLVMEAVDEAHLLNISVAEDVQGEGFGHLLLDYAVDLARKHKMTIMLLEVRVSNLRALHVYKRYGFVEIGRRKKYYPVDQHTREDAIVMSLPL